MIYHVAPREASHKRKARVMVLSALVQYACSPHLLYLGLFLQFEFLFSSQFHPCPLMLQRAQWLEEVKACFDLHHTNAFRFLSFCCVPFRSQLSSLIFFVCSFLFLPSMSVNIREYKHVYNVTIITPSSSAAACFIPQGIIGLSQTFTSVRFYSLAIAITFGINVPQNCPFQAAVQGTAYLWAYLSGTSLSNALSVHPVSCVCMIPPLSCFLIFIDFSGWQVNLLSLPSRISAVFLSSEWFPASISPSLFGNISIVFSVTWSMPVSGLYATTERTHWLRAFRFN